MTPDPSTNHVGSTDANGNTLYNGYIDCYDVENRFTGPGGFYGAGSFQYSYAPGNKRVWRGVFGTGNYATDEITFWSVSGQKMTAYNIQVNNGTEYAPPSITFNLSVANYYFGGKLIGHYTSLNGLSTAAADRLGSIGHFYPYGQEKPSATTNGTEKFTGYFRDSETGLDYADQRYHNPGTGRFLSPEVGVPQAADLIDPGSWNRYAYVGGDPMNYVDTFGTNRAVPPSPDAFCNFALVYGPRGGRYQCILCLQSATRSTPPATAASRSTSMQSDRQREGQQ